MRIKVELHRTVLWFLRHEASTGEIEVFYQRLGQLTTDPVALIEHSEAIHDPEASRYMLRFFRFEGCIAVFETNRARDRILVRQCQRLPQQRPGNRPRDDGP